MCLIYKNVESLEKPLEAEDTATGVYFRKNITTKEKDGNTVYCYEEGFLTLEEYKNSSIYFNRERNKGLQNQINELELKRIRAFIEPGVKDEKTGETWLAYRTAQIEELRKQMT